jgi:hypothetical protein
MIQESPSTFFLTVSGILKPRHAAHRSKIPIAGAVTPPVGKKHGRSSVNGSGTCAWNWAITCTLILSALPSVHLHTRRRPLLPLLHRALRPPLSPHPGKPVASRAQTLFSSPMGRCAALLERP